MKHIVSRVTCLVLVAGALASSANGQSVTELRYGTLTAGVSDLSSHGRVATGALSDGRLYYWTRCFGIRLITSQGGGSVSWTNGPPPVLAINDEATFVLTHRLTGPPTAVTFLGASALFPNGCISGGPKPSEDCRVLMVTPSGWDQCPGATSGGFVRSYLDANYQRVSGLDNTFNLKGLSNAPFNAVAGLMDVCAIPFSTITNSAYLYRDSTGFQCLNDGTVFPSDARMTVFGISADANVVMGGVAASNHDGLWRWTEQSGMTAVTNIPSYAANSSTDQVMSSDGSTVVGIGRDANQDWFLWRWTVTAGYEDLGPYLLSAGITLPQSSLGKPVEISADGTVVVIQSGGFTNAMIIDLAHPRCSADVLRDGGVSVGDLFAFLSDWFSENGEAGVALAADFGCDEAVSIDDLFEYLAAWFAQVDACE